MLNDKNYVFILGAGASMDFEFPSGLSLVQDVIRILNYNPGVRELIGSLSDYPQLIDPFVTALRNSGMQSVDAFLERQNVPFNSIGKLAIAAALLPYEKEDVLYSLKLKEVNWYDYVFQKMTDGAPTYDAFKQNTVTFLTYNYDRTLEFYLYNAIIAMYPNNVKDSFEILLELPIVHLHGSLGCLQTLYFGSQPVSGVKFGQKINEHSIAEGAKGIKIIHEDIGESEQFNKARSILTKADIIMFLGFGFHPKNVERLKLASLNCNDYFATLVGMEAGEVWYIKQMFEGRAFEHSGSKIRRALRDSGILPHPPNPGPPADAEVRAPVISRTPQPAPRPEL